MIKKQNNKAQGEANHSALNHSAFKSPEAR